MQYTYVFSSNPNSDGIAEADAAIAAAQSLGITTPIIYKDIENYYGNTALCTSSQQTAAALAVQAFVGGWDSELHTKGYLAGAYGNPTPAKNDFSKASPIPDDVWITKTPASGKPPQVTIWNLGLSDNLWPNSQRMHQFLINQSSPTFGGQNLNEPIDDDIDNATIASANNGAKTYSTYNYSSINYPGAFQSEVYSINNIWDGAMINGPGEVGQVVGQYTDSSGVQHGMLVDGLIGYTSIDYPGATLTVATGINNLSQIVGYWANSTTGQSGGFYLDSGTCSNYCSFNYPGSTSTVPLGINDAGQIVGTYGPGNPNYGFLYYRGKGGAFYSINYPGGAQTLAGGINGDGNIAGEYQNTTTGAINGFVEYAIPPSWTGTFSTVDFPGALNTYLMGINNDNEMTGYYWTSTSPVEGFQIYSIQDTSFQYPGTGISTYLYSTNDFGQAAGTYIPPSDITGGFVAIPQ